MATTPNRGSWNETVRIIVLMVTGVLRERKLRRMVMTMLLVVVLLFLGVGLLWMKSLLSAGWMWFGGYWLVCAGLTGFLFLLALYDLLRVRTEQKEAMRELRERLQREVHKEASR